LTIEFLAWVAEKLTQEQKKALLLVWDNASWHKARAVKAWVKAHNRTAKKQGTEGGCRILLCFLPSKSPWLNRIEPKWVHGKRAIVEPSRKLSQQELKQRLCDYYQCEMLPPLTQTLTKPLTQ
jgi:transposase